MSRRPAKVTQADLARAIRAARQAGGGDVLIMQDGTIVIQMSPSSTGPANVPLAEEREIVL